MKSQFWTPFDYQLKLPKEIFHRFLSYLVSNEKFNWFCVDVLLFLIDQVVSYFHSNTTKDLREKNPIYRWSFLNYSYLN